MNSTELQNKPKQKQPKRYQPRSGFSLWLDEWQCKRTVAGWKRAQKQAAQRKKRKAMFEKIPYSHVAGDALYILGFWIEYLVVRFNRSLERVVRAVAVTTGNLLMLILRPFVLGLQTIWQDLTSPFVRMFSGLRHINELVDEYDEDADKHQARTARAQYFRSGAKRYMPLLWNAGTYLLPVVTAVGLFFFVRDYLGQNYVLNVQVNGQTVGYVTSETVFENAREDVQSRINSAKRQLAEAGTVVPDTQWDIQPTYTLATATQTMTESEIANAILRTAGDEIVNGTAVYVDDELRFVTTEGDHMRTYLESIKDPYENALDTSRRVDFAHNIRLIDGVYLQQSVEKYSDVIAELNSGAEVQTYTAVDGDTVESIVNATGVSFDALAQMNPQLLSLDQEVEEGAVITTGASSPELLKVKVVQRYTSPEDIPFEKQNTESSDLAFGKVEVRQQGEIGAQEVTYDDTYIDNVLVSRDIVNINVIKEPVAQITVTGTKLASGMVAQLGSGSFVWPVPQYTYVSRWASSYHRGADICAAYGTTIIASDSGTVTEAGYHYSWGNYVKIDHGNGYQTLYGHMSSIAVTRGQGVSQGQTIGYVGSTGNSTGNHCHFEMYRNGVLFSAQTLFGGR